MPDSTPFALRGLQPARLQLAPKLCHQLSVYSCFCPTSLMEYREVAIFMKSEVLTLLPTQQMVINCIYFIFIACVFKNDNKDIIFIFLHTALDLPHICPATCWIALPISCTALVH